MRKGTPSIVKDLKLNTLSADSVLTVPFYPVALPATGLPGTIAYLASTSSLNYWTGTQWLSINAGPITVYSINNTGAAANSVISNGTGPTFILKGISAADSTITVSSTSDNVTIAGNYSVSSVGTGYSLVDNGTGPNFAMKSLNAGNGISITGILSQTLNISSNVLESISTQNWRAGSSSSVGTSQCVAVGDSADAGDGTGNVAVGYNATIAFGTDGAVVIGAGSSVGASQCVAIGDSADAGTGTENVAIGYKAVISPSVTNAVVIGAGSSSKSRAVCIKGSIGPTSSLSVAILGTIGSTSPNAVAIGANANIGNSSSNSIAIIGSIGDGTTNAVAIGAINNVSNTAVIGNGSNFILGTPGLLQSGAQWGASAQLSSLVSMSSGIIAFDFTLIDPYSAIAGGGTQVTLQKANQMYHVSASILMTWSGTGTADATITLTRNGSPSRVICVNQITTSVTTLYTATLSLSGITVSGNVTTDYITASITTGVGSLVPSIQTSSYINVHRIN